MSALPQRGPAAAAELQALRASAGRMDPASLFAALRRLGYGWEQLRFASHATIESPNRLIQALELDDDPPRARIVLNLGLLGPQSPLPSYIFKELDAGTVDAATFFRFVGFFDHVALARLLLALHPELDRQLFADYAHARQEELQLLNLRSTATLHWLFQQLFPELAVRVETLRKARLLRTGAVRLGNAEVGGEESFGGRARALGPGRRVTLSSDAERAGSGLPWPMEARARLDERVLPLLRQYDVQLELYLVIREQQSWARLNDGSHLGYEQLRGAQARHELKIFDSSEEEKS
jgi:hypothetical protein